MRDADYFPSESVDLIYLDPPFNSNQDYALLFRGVEGIPTKASIKAFKDTWVWDETAAESFHDLNAPDSLVPRTLVLLMNSFEEFLGHSPMFAYLLMMSVRLVELHRVLKPTGSLFLHCDPTASHYLKLILDGVFSPWNFKNEIIWHYRRWPAKSKRLQRMHNVILFYGREDAVFNTIHEPYGDWIEKDYKYIDEDGRRWRWHSPHGVRQKVYLDDPELGVPINDVWMIPFIGSTAKERMGYPTQKPLALLTRIITIASNPGAVILDPFCGSGTTIAAVETLNLRHPHDLPRKWIGIDIGKSAIELVTVRLKELFGLNSGDYLMINSLS